MTARPDREPVSTAFFGSGSFAVPILDALLADPQVVVDAVVTSPDRTAGRNAVTARVPVARHAAERSVRLLQPERLRDPDFVAALAELRPGLGIVADYGRLVPPDVLALPARGFLNVHPSLLPRHRGASPIAATILAGDSEAGVSVMQMDPGLDTGPLVASEGWPLDGTETAPELEARAATAGARLLTVVLGPWLAGDRPAVRQDEARATLSRPLRREDGRLDPTRPAVELERAVRAYMPWPGTFVDTTAGRIAVHRAEVAPAVAGDEPGFLVADRDGLALATAEGRLRLLEVQSAGGRRMAGADWRRGRREVIDTRVV